MIPQSATTVTLDIRVYPLVEKFLSYHFDTAPFVITNVKNPYATYLKGCLDRYDCREQILPKKFDKLTASLTIGITKWDIKRSAAGTLSPQKVGAFNDFVRQMFFEKLTNEVTLHTFRGVGIKAATQNYLDRYGITEDELSIEMALRYYGRARRKLMLHHCPVSAPADAVILSHEGDSTDWQMESGRRQVA